MADFRYLVVDGHSVIFHWPELRRLHSIKRAHARDLLVQRLRELHDSGRWRVTLVFDGREGTVESARPGEMVVAYAPEGETADSVIERLVGSVQDPSKVTVVTADRAEQRLVESLGASVFSPDWLLEEMEILVSNMQDRLRSVSRKAKW